MITALNVRTATIVPIFALIALKMVGRVNIVARIAMKVAEESYCVLMKNQSKTIHGNHSP